MHPIVTDFSRDALARANEENLCEVYRLLGQSPRIQLEEAADIFRVESSVPHSMLNRVLVACIPEHEGHDRITGTIEYYRARGIPWVWEVGPGTRSEGFVDRLEACGLTCRGGMAGMAMDLSLLPDQQDSAPSLMIQEVMDDHALDRWAEVCTNGFNMPREVLDVMAEAILPGGFGEQASIRCFLAYQNEIPVACSALSLGAGVAGIYSVTTLPVARKQGIGAVVTAHPLYIARDLGYRVGILQASSMGFPVYQRLGFEECCSFALYA